MANINLVIADADLLRLAKALCALGDFDTVNAANAKQALIALLIRLTKDYEAAERLKIRPTPPLPPDIT